MKYKLIKSKEQYVHYCATLEQLLLTNLKQDEIELLTLLIESWDSDHNSVPDVDNVTMLRYLMQEHGLRVTDLADILAVGPRLISEILGYKRAMPPGMARRLAKHFRLQKEIFESRR